MTEPIPVWGQAVVTWQQDERPGERVGPAGKSEQVWKQEGEATCQLRGRLLLLPPVPWLLLGLERKVLKARDGKDSFGNK